MKNKYAFIVNAFCNTFARTKSYYVCPLFTNKEGLVGNVMSWPQ